MTQSPGAWKVTGLPENQAPPPPYTLRPDPPHLPVGAPPPPQKPDLSITAPLTASRDSLFKDSGTSITSLFLWQGGGGGGIKWVPSGCLQGVGGVGTREWIRLGIPLSHRPRIKCSCYARAPSLSVSFQGHQLASASPLSC